MRNYACFKNNFRVEETTLVLPIILIIFNKILNIYKYYDCKRVRTTYGATTTPVFRRFSSFSLEEEEEEERIFFFECGN